MKYLSYLYKSTFRHSAIIVFTVLSIMLAFLLFGVLQGVDRAVKSAIDGAHVDRIHIVSAVNGFDPLPLSHLNKIQHVKGISNVSYIAFFGGYYQDPRNTLDTIAIEPKPYFQLRRDLSVSPGAIGRMSEIRFAAIAGKGLAKKHNWKIGDRVPIVATVWPMRDGSMDWAFEIVGRNENSANESQNNGLLINYEFLDENRFEGARGYVSRFIASLKDETSYNAVREQIDSMFNHSSHATKTQNEFEYAQSVVRQIGNAGFLITSITVTVFVTLLLLTFANSMQSFRARIPVIATLKSIGFNDKAVFLLIVGEVMLLYLIGSILGTLLAIVLFPVFEPYIGSISMPLSAITTAILIAMGMALMTSIVPAVAASRLSIVTALAIR